MAKLLYQGHGSFRITSSEEKVIYVDPYAGDGYDLEANLILVSHQHGDHNQVNLIASKSADCVLITEREAIRDGSHQLFDLGFAQVEAVYAGNKNHDPAQCVGYLITVDGVVIYASCDTSMTEQMADLASRKIDYALFCCDGMFNMGVAEASECAALVGARYSIPYHMAPGKLFDQQIAEQFQAAGRLILADGEEIELT